MSPLKTITFNAEGLTSTKAHLLASLKADILCLQETHKESVPPNIPGMHLIIHRPSRVHGSAIYAREKSAIVQSDDLSYGEIEILQIKMKQITIVSVYKPPPVPFNWPANHNINNQVCLILGDFNSHSTTWGYNETNTDGDAVERWAIGKDLCLLHNSKDEPSFQSARWRRGYNPDLIFVTSRHIGNFTKYVEDPIPRSQHRPLSIIAKPVIAPIKSRPINRFNFRKAGWDKFTEELDNRVVIIDPEPDNYETFQNSVWKVAKDNIPRGCRKTYIPSLGDENKELYRDYEQSYNEDPFSENTIQLGENLLASISEERKNCWRDMITNINLTRNSKKAWKTLKKLNTEQTSTARTAAVTPNSVANQLLLNGKPNNKERGYLKKTKTEMNQVLQSSDEIFFPFTMGELQEAINTLKPGKAAGLDGITPEMIKHFGIKTLEWIRALFNNCAATFKLPKIWKKAKVAALLKPKKDPKLPTSYRPISLFCTLYKLYERMILGRIQPTVDDHLSPDQAGFRPGRSCCGQVLNLTQYIEDGFENKLITGTVFVDLTAAYDTVNHRALLLKIAKIVRNTTIVHIIESLLTNRRFFVEMDGKRSRWRLQKNGLPQGSVLAPILFNIYTNDQPQFNNIRRFIYADDLCIATQAKDFTIIEERLNKALEDLTKYYEKWFLNANPRKTQVCAFHLHNRLANRTLNIKWGDRNLESNKFPVYLGVTLDRTLSFKQHVEQLKKKLSSRNTLLGKLANSSWGADPATLKQTAIALCYSTAEYCAPIWSRSCHAQKIDAELNKACRIITGNLKPTPLPDLYKLASISPPSIRRDAITKAEREKQLSDNRHPMYNHQRVQQRLRSRKSFVTVNRLGNESLSTYRLRRWMETEQHHSESIPKPSEDLSNGASLSRKDWVALNRARAKTGRTGDNLFRWGLAENAQCACGESVQTMDHILRSCPEGPSCSNEDLLEANQPARDWLLRWRDKI